ncbi:glycosyltransferase [Algibacter mikhailovii]|uniref:glycosyltransferase n=1 Tax=Algibacter mikhailovii TaxID=425498 RepID=UPI00249478C8|nr:glycosyltransferase [Algibacter mikhailovii]
MALLDIVFCAFIVVVVIQVFYYLLLFSRFAFSKQEKASSENHPVSVIICAKNEGTNLKTFLPSIVSQKYPKFEIVLINDSSSDDTLEVIKHFESQHDNIKVVDVKGIEAFWGNKKYALTLGIKASSYDYLLFTDADCQPLSEFWIQEMSAHFSTKKSIVLGYGAYAKVKKSFLNKLVRFETVTTAINYFSFALAGMPYMGVGRNLAYSKDEFFKANGFINHIKLHSGDDDLFVNQVATSQNTAVVFSKDAFTESKPKANFNAWFKQKRRHVTTAKHYQSKHKVLLGMLFSSNLFFWLLSCFLFLTGYEWKIVLGLFLSRLTIQYITFGFSSKKLNEKDLIYFLPILEIFLIITQFTIFIINLISKPSHWK